jgi:L-2-hydroxyglutarate oxidase LhgO
LEHRCCRHRRQVTGLAAAAAIARRGASVCVVERHARPGLDTSTHNSGVIHAGIYYPAGSLKARLCVEGRHMMYEFCSAHDVPFIKSGKVIVAADESEVPALAALKARGDANGVEGLELVDSAFVTKRDTAVHSGRALYSPASGIVNPEDYVKRLIHDA